MFQACEAAIPCYVSLPFLSGVNVLTAARVREVISYNPKTGTFRWLSTGTGRIQDSVGWMMQGYHWICIDGQSCAAHRLAWLYMTGEWPAVEIDHANGDRADNRFVNLREATNSDNAKNRKCRSDNKSGLKGVCFRKDKKDRPWHARIVIEGRRRSLGFYSTAEEAHEVYCAAAWLHYGQFARTE